MSALCSIIIPSYETRALTLACIAHIRRHPPSCSYEIIVVDNDSKDGTYEAVLKEHPTVKALRNPRNLGFSKACNRGASVAAGRYLLFLNSDTEALPDAFDRLIQWLEKNPQAGIVGPELVSPEGRIIQMSWGWNPVLVGELAQQYFAPYCIQASSFKRRWARWFQRRPRSVPVICGACLMIRREVFESLKGFDEDFELYFEDSDLCWRCIKIGWRVDFVPSAKIIHRLGQSSKGKWHMPSIIYRQSHIHYYRKHAPAWSIPLLKLYLLGRLAGQWLLYLREKDRPVRARAYLGRFLEVLLEKRRLHLTETLPA